MTFPLPDAGLRAVKKERTREALSQAAIAIVAAEGIDALTADRIAAEAGVARRTLFNYFARVEDVLIHSLGTVTQHTVAAFVARPAGESLRESVRAVLAELFDDPVFAQALILERAADQSPATRRFLREFADTQIDAFETGLHDRLGEDADPVYVAALAAAIGAIVTRMTRLVVARTPEGGADLDVLMEQLHISLEQSFDLLFTGFDDAGAPGAVGAPARSSPRKEN